MGDGPTQHSVRKILQFLPVNKFNIMRMRFRLLRNLQLKISKMK